MNRTTPERAAPRPIKGSWEELHEKAQQHARNYNDEAIPIYQRLLNGLLALSPAARMAGDNRLYNLMMTAGVELQGYFNLRDRPAESLTVIDRLLTVVAETDKPQLVELKSDVLLQAERGEEAVAILREQATSADGDTGDWGHIVAAYLRLGQPEAALATIDEMDGWIEAKIADGTVAGQDVPATRDYQERLRMAALIEGERTEEAMALFDQLYAADSAEAINPQLLYTYLLRIGEHDAALRYINRDNAHPVRAAFWRGIAYRQKGEEARSQRIWQDATKEKFVRGDMPSIVEHILTLYYLGDPKGEGLEMMLRAQREQSRVAWMLFYLTGLGWILRGDDGAAHSNLRLAVAQIKSMGEGKALAHQYWRFVRELAPAERAAKFARYFETEPKQATHASSQDEGAVSSEDTTDEPSA